MVKIKLYLFYLLPKNILSRVVGFFASARIPIFVPLVIAMFRRWYKIDMSLANHSKFKTFNEFFTRTLKPECRPVDSHEDTIVSPVDGIVGYGGKVENGILFQAKGLQYTLEEFLVKKEYCDLFAEGDYITLYLSPRHYHRIHTPVAGQVESMLYIPGTLYPVNEFAVYNVPRLFARNERLISIMSHPSLGKVAVVKVGATIVGKIKIVYDSVESNLCCRRLLYKEYQDVQLGKGEELGKFELGSTVILLFEKGKADLSSMKLGMDVFFGAAIGKIVPE